MSTASIQITKTLKPDGSGNFNSAVQNAPSDAVLWYYIINKDLGSITSVGTSTSSDNWKLSPQSNPRLTGAIAFLADKGTALKSSYSLTSLPTIGDDVLAAAMAWVRLTDDELKDFLDASNKIAKDIQNDSAEASNKPDITATQLNQDLKSGGMMPGLLTSSQLSDAATAIDALSTPSAAAASTAGCWACKVGMAAPVAGIAAGIVAAVIASDGVAALAIPPIISLLESIGLATEVATSVAGALSLGSITSVTAVIESLPGLICQALDAC